MESPTTSETAAEAFDSSKPLQGVVVCCTSIPPDQRTEIASRTIDLGGVHKYDLTPDVTHLIVGDYDTPKYRHVAKERSDIKPMTAGWIDAVRTLWMNDQEIDFRKLEYDYTLKTFETRGEISGSFTEEGRQRGRLLCCLTGFQDNDQRQYIEEAVRANGGEYTGDLSRKVTHLIVHQPEGKKYKAAKDWGVWAVSIEWLEQSIQRGMILDESAFDPVLPKEDRGKGAWVKKTKCASLVKRARDETAAPANDGRRKLRKTASLKMLSQGQNIWGDILGNQSQQPLVDTLRSGPEKAATMPIAAHAALVVPVAACASAGSQNHTGQPQPQPIPGPLQAEGVFSDCRFFVHGYSQEKFQIVCEHLSSHGGQVSSSLDDVVSSSHPESPDRRFLLVPQDSQPDTHPLLPDGVHIVTEFYIERCLAQKQLFEPNNHVLGRPFPRFPIEGFQNLVISTAGFRDEQLMHVEKSVTFLGGKYSEKLNSQSSVLVCTTLEGVRKPKLAFAMYLKVPVVSAEWLWQCISSGFLIPWDEFLIQGLKQQLSIDLDPDFEREKQKLQRTRSEPYLKQQKSEFRAPRAKSGLDRTAFVDEKPEAPEPTASVAQKQETTESHFETALTYQEQEVHGPLSEVPFNTLNKPPSPTKTEKPHRKTLQRVSTEGTVADSEGGESDTTANPIEKVPSAEDIEAQRKREYEQKKAVEREALSKQFKNLLDTNNDTAAKDSSEVPKDGLQPRLQRRKREIMGRAVSNVSAASSTSGDSSAQTTANTTVESIKGTPAGLSMLDGVLGGQDKGLDAEEMPPPATQVDYDNPEARQHRATILNRIHGNKEDTSARKHQEKVTLQGMRRDQSSRSGGVPSGVRKSKRRL